MDTRHTVHAFTQTLPSHLHTNQIICNTYNDEWFVWRDGPSHNPSLHTNHPFTQTIYHSLYYISSHEPSLHTNHLSFFEIILFVWIGMINGLCEGKVCVNGWFVWRDGLCLVSVMLMIIWLCEVMVCVTCIHPFAQTIYHSLFYIPSHKPSLHTNHLSFSVLHIIWLLWRDGYKSHCPCLHINHPFTQNHLSLSVLHIIWFV